jgi:hypothetical protein
MAKRAKRPIRTKPPRCPACLIGGYRLADEWDCGGARLGADGRPRFICTRCGHEWTCGATGGEYLATADTTPNRPVRLNCSCKTCRAWAAAMPPEAARPRMEE